MEKEERDMKASPYVTTIRIAVEDSGPTTMSDSDLSEQSISINMENSDPDSISETCQRNPDSCDKTKTTSDYGVTNLGFVKDGDESKDNKERKQKCSSSSFEDIPMSSDTDCETVSKVELADLSPRVITSLSTKNGLTEEQYKEYFMSGNELRTSLRREKTKEESRSNCCKLCCWLLSLTLLAGAVTVAVLIGIGVIDTDPVRQVKESRNLEIQDANIEEFHPPTFMEVTNNSGPNVLTNDPAFFFSVKSVDKDIKNGQEQRIGEKFKEESNNKPQNKNPQHKISNINDKVSTIVNEPTLKTSTAENESETEATMFTELEKTLTSTNLGIIDSLPDTKVSAVHDQAQYVSKDDSDDDGTAYVSKHDSVKNVSKAEIISEYEGSAEHELAEGSADPQAVVGGVETGSGEEDSVTQHIPGPAEEIDFMEVENMLEDLGTLESLEVNNKEPRQLGNIETESPVQADFVAGQFLAD